MSSQAKLAAVDLTNAYYARFGAPDPDVGGISGLGKLKPLDREQITGLVQLQNALQEAGLRDDERELTNSIQRNLTDDRLSHPWWSIERIQGLLRVVFFDWSTGYGLHPERALLWILLIGAVLTPAYTLAMLFPTEKSRVVQVFPQDRIDVTMSDPAAERERKKVIKATNLWSALGWASYFSLLSSVNIGFEPFPPGDWIRGLQAREYSLEAIGWVRVAAGSQALLSVFLLAMWLLTQFGRPFQ